MTDAIVHRGPDDSGVWIDETAGVALGHRRLSILDLSPAGRQPMVSATGRYVLSFNGEIYNHAALRAELAGREWRGHSDTETLLACIEAWGIEPAIRKSVGMFAAAVWDRAERRLVLLRDRMGEKPLYYGWQRNTFLFGSELKALTAHPDFSAAVDRNALRDYLRQGYVLAPHSIYEDIKKLPPGSMLTLEADSRRTSTHAYWSLQELSDGAETRDLEPELAIEELDARVTEAVGLQKFADVPLGAFLSGGIDSAVVVAILQRNSSMPVKTFTIGFREQGYDEASRARAVAEHLGTDHSELYISPSQAMEVVPSLARIYDEPLGDASQIPTLLVSNLARSRVTVALSGDGGDELFGGYDYYSRIGGLADKAERAPRWARKAAAKAFRRLPEVAVNAFLDPLINLRGRRPSVPPAERLGALSYALAADGSEAFYWAMIPQWPYATRVVLGADESGLALVPPPGFRRPARRTAAERMMLVDALTYLPDDILVKVDRAAMSVSLETRMPFLDHRIVEFAAALPVHAKMRNGVGKWLLRRVLDKYVPRELVAGPKMGFRVPVGQWLRQEPLRGWAEDLLSESRLRRDGILDPAPVRRRWAHHVSGRYNFEASLWSLLMFQAWLAETASSAQPCRAHR